MKRLKKERVVFYVSLKGNDAWSGLKPAPDRTRTDGPFATLQCARDAIRELKRRQGGALKQPVAVCVRGGTYELSEPFALTSEDSGSADAPIAYGVRRGEEVRLVGGKCVTNFEPVTDPHLLSRLDEGARGHVLQANLKALGVTDYGEIGGGFGHEGGPGLELFFQDRPMTLARWPNEGFVRIVDTVEHGTIEILGMKGSKEGQFVYEGDRPRRWVGEKDVRLNGYWFFDWAEQRQKVQSIDVEKRVITLAPPHHEYGYRKGQWYYAFNILAELDAPGEWCLDRETGVLYFWPPAPIDQGRAVVSVLPALITMKDTQSIRVAGMIIEAVRGDAVTITGGTECRIERCTLRNTGSWAVKIAAGGRNGVSGCEITQTADGGISLSGGDRATLTPAGHYAENNHIHRYSRWNRTYRAAIALSGVGNRAAHNLIHDAPHNAISFGGNDHAIEFNEIHRVCYETNDGGAIYAGREFTMRGTVIRHNFLHHIRGFENRGCVGIYLDDCFCGTTIYGNVFYDVTMAAFIGGGRDNIVANNVFVDCEAAVHIDARALGWAKHLLDAADSAIMKGLKSVDYKQPPYRKRYPKLPQVLDDEPASPRGNKVLRNICFGGRWLDVEEKAEPLVRFKDNLVSRQSDARIEIKGDVEYPKRWLVFGTLQADPQDIENAACLSKSELERVPDRIVADAIALEGKPVEMQESVLDLGRLFGGWKVGLTAYAFATLAAEREGEVTLGACADWWMRWWVNGALVCDTTKTGNGPDRLGIGNHVFNAWLRAGVNTLAVQAISGRATFRLMAGGPRELGAIKQAALAVSADPRFVDIARMNFQLRDDSPAFAMGFKRIPFERIGLTRK